MPDLGQSTPARHSAPLLAIVYAILAAAVLWPLPLHLADSVALGTEDVHTVPFAMVYPFWWQADRLTHGLAGFWDAPIFFPTPRTFALSETNTLGAFALAPVVAATGSAALGHNLFLFGSLVLNGVAGRWLALVLGLRAIVAALLGVGFVLLPVPLQELGVLPLVPVWGILWTYGALHGWARAPSWSGGARLGLALAASYLCCFQYALFLVILLGLVGVALVPRRALRPRALATLLLGGALAGGLVAPVVRGQLDGVASSDFDRSQKKVEKLACKPRHYLRTPFRQAIPTPGIGVAGQAGWKAFWPGTTRVLLAAAGLAVALAGAGSLRWGLFFGLGAIVAYALSLGPFLRLGGFSPWEALGDVVPGYAKVRSINRWAVFVQIHALMLAGWGLQAVLERAEAARAGVRRRAGMAAFALLGALVGAEIWPRPQRLASVPDPSEHVGWTQAVRALTPPDAVLAFLPFSVGGEVEDYVPDTRWMLLQPEFDRRMANGYSSYFPAPFRGLKRALAEFPVGAWRGALADVGVTHVVVDAALHPGSVLFDAPEAARGLRLLHRDAEAGLDLYEVVPP